jgi:hypothetical protein
MARTGKASSSCLITFRFPESKLEPCLNQKGIKPQVQKTAVSKRKMPPVAAPVKIANAIPAINDNEKRIKISKLFQSFIVYYLRVIIKI